jgi:hypothetical protein
MNSSPAPTPDLTTQWSVARKLYPLYVELSREFVIDVPACADLEAGLDAPGAESVQEANRWLEEMDERVQVHQLRQFLQTSSLANQEGLLHLLRHFLSKAAKNAAVRDKTDFLLVQYFSQIAPAHVDDNEVDLAFVANVLEPVLGTVELKIPVWLNALDRVLEATRRCPSLDELLHGGILDQGRKIKTQAGDLFFLPVALVAFTRFGYLMRRVFFRLMHGDLNAILDGLNELEEKNVETIDCRRAQFSAEEPIMRLRMICQSWKVLFQAEYSSGQPLRMLVDLRAAVEDALGRGKAQAENEKKSAPNAGRAMAAAAGATAAKTPANRTGPQVSTAGKQTAGTVPGGGKAKVKAAGADVPEFEIGASDWDPDAGSQPGQRKD